MFYAPDFFGNPDNYMQANPLVTPSDIVPEWYLLPFYAMLRSIPQKLIGVLVLVGALVTLFFVPWLDTSKVRSCRFRPLMKQCFWLFVLDCVLLGYVGSQTGRRRFFGHGNCRWCGWRGSALCTITPSSGSHAAGRPDRDAQSLARKHRQVRAWSKAAAAE